MSFMRLALLAVLLFTVGTLGAQPAPVASLLDNATCLGCHSQAQSSGSDTLVRKLRPVASAAYASSVHANMTCVACHPSITDNAEISNMHRRDPALKPAKVDCAGCHQQLLAQAKQDGTVQNKPRLLVVAQNAETWQSSMHARPNADDATRPNAACDNCHDTHSFHVPTKDSPQYTAWRLGVPKTCGQNCHEDQFEAYSSSVHGQEVMQKNNTQSAVCIDCHGVHSVSNSSSDPFKLAVTQRCGSCHQEQLKSYRATYHGQINTLGHAYTAKCYDCHGSHKVLKVSDPHSKVHPDNRLKTCETCHNGKHGVFSAPTGFVSFQPHGHTGDFNRYPQMWVAWKIMVQLLVGTFAFFWLHTLLWFYRERKERLARGDKPRIRIEAIPEHIRDKHVRRFSRTWRIAHISFALCVMTLTLTGMPIFYSHAAWAPVLMSALGGPHIAGLIHRTCATLFVSIFVWHLAYVGWRIARNWKDFKIFGSTSLVPNLQDLRDMVAMFKWFLGKGQRPKFDRWAYWEKFDYWAPFWGVTVVGASGLIMWQPGFFGSVLPGWVFNVAAIFHGEEAFLAVVFLFTVHFFNNHFRPDKFPLDRVMFIGTQSVEEFKNDHNVEYHRLLQSGELNQYLVDAPSAAKLTAAKWLGFTLIACGLTLLTLVGVGFFTTT